MKSFSRSIATPPHLPEARPRRRMTARRPPIDRPLRRHAEALLAWLQSQERIVGRRGVIQIARGDALTQHLCKSLGREDRAIDTTRPGHLRPSLVRFREP